MAILQIYHTFHRSLYKAMENLVFKLQRFYSSCLTNYWLGVLRKLIGPKLKGQSLRSHHHQPSKAYACVVEAVPVAVVVEAVPVPGGPFFDFEEGTFVEVLLVVEDLTFVGARIFEVLHYERVLNLRNVGDHHQEVHFDALHRHRLFRQQNCSLQMTYPRASPAYQQLHQL